MRYASDYEMWLLLAWRRRIGSRAAERALAYAHWAKRSEAREFFFGGPR